MTNKLTIVIFTLFFTHGVFECIFLHFRPGDFEKTYLAINSQRTADSKMIYKITAIFMKTDSSRKVTNQGIRRFIPLINRKSKELKYLKHFSGSGAFFHDDWIMDTTPPMTHPEMIPMNK